MENQNEQHKTSSEMEDLKSKEELIKLLNENESDQLIHPVQDFVNGVMYYGVKIKGMPYLVTSNRKCFSLVDAPQKGLSLKLDDFDITRFSKSGLAAFLNGRLPISASQLFSKIKIYIKNFVVFQEAGYLSMLALWVMGTYVFRIFQTYPYLWINAEKGSGKTTLMNVLSEIAFNGELIITPSEAVIFRDIEVNSITMCIDEFEQLSSSDKDIKITLLSVLNSGFSKTGTIKRIEKTGKNNFKVVKFSAYSPKIFAGIKQIHDVLRDRTIRINILKKKESEKTSRYKKGDELEKLQSAIRDDLYNFGLHWAADIYSLYHSSSVKGAEALENRELDIWEPIFHIANLIDKEVGQDDIVLEMQKLSLESWRSKQADNSEDSECHQILQILKSMFKEISPLKQADGQLFYPAEHVKKFFHKNEFELYALNGLTSKLRRMGVAKSIQIRESEIAKSSENRIRVYSFNSSVFEDQYLRYFGKSLSQDAVNDYSAYSFDVSKET